MWHTSANGVECDRGWWSLPVLGNQPTPLACWVGPAAVGVGSVVVTVPVCASQVVRNVCAAQAVMALQVSTRNE